MGEGDAAEPHPETIQEMAPAQTQCRKRTGAERANGSCFAWDLHRSVTNSSRFIKALARTVVAATSPGDSDESRGRSPVFNNFSAAAGYESKALACSW